MQNHEPLPATQPLPATVNRQSSVRKPLTARSSNRSLRFTISATLPERAHRHGKHPGAERQRVLAVVALHQWTASAPRTARERAEPRRARRVPGARRRNRSGLPSRPVRYSHRRRSSTRSQQLSRPSARALSCRTGAAHGSAPRAYRRAPPEAGARRSADKGRRAYRPILTFSVGQS